MYAVVYFRAGFDPSVALHNTHAEAWRDWAEGVYELEGRLPPDDLEGEALVEAAERLYEDRGRDYYLEVIDHVHLPEPEKE
jgi:hypothetical protein